MLPRSLKYRFFRSIIFFLLSARELSSQLDYRQVLCHRNDVSCNKTSGAVGRTFCCGCQSLGIPGTKWGLNRWRVFRAALTRPLDEEDGVTDDRQAAEQHGRHRDERIQQPGHGDGDGDDVVED